MRTTYERRLATGLLVSVASVAAITLAIYGLRELVPVVSTGVVYMLAVLLVAGGWGLWLGLLTAVLSAAAFNFFHIPPTGQFTIAEGENWVALAVFFVAAAVTSTLANAARARASDAERDRAEADLTAEMARLLLGGESLERSLHTVGQRIAQTFNLRSVAVEPSWVAIRRAADGRSPRRRRELASGRWWSQPRRTGPCSTRSRTASSRRSRRCSPRRAAETSSRHR